MDCALIALREKSITVPKLPCSIAASRSLATPSSTVRMNGNIWQI